MKESLSHLKNKQKITTVLSSQSQLNFLNKLSKGAGFYSLTFIWSSAHCILAHTHSGPLTHLVIFTRNFHGPQFKDTFDLLIPTFILIPTAECSVPSFVSLSPPSPQSVTPGPKILFANHFSNLLNHLVQVFMIPQLLFCSFLIRLSAFNPALLQPVFQSCSFCILSQWQTWSCYLWLQTLPWLITYKL